MATRKTNTAAATKDAVVQRRRVCPLDRSSKASANPAARYTGPQYDIACNRLDLAIVISDESSIGLA